VDEGFLPDTLLHTVDSLSADENDRHHSFSGNNLLHAGVPRGRRARDAERVSRSRLTITLEIEPSPAQRDPSTRSIAAGIDLNERVPVARRIAVGARQSSARTRDRV
jgi:hypothetical protein